MVCRTTINGRWDTGQIALRVDLIEREGDPVARLQIFGPPGSFLQPGIKLTVDQGSPIQIPYVICLTNGCVAGSVATASLIHDLEAGQMLALETVNSNVVGVTTSVPLKEFAEFTRGHRRKCLSSGSKEIGSNWVDEKLPASSCVASAQSSA
jgi:invasion protein IalB